MAALKPPAPAPPPLYSSFVTVHPLQQPHTHTHTRTHTATVQQQWRPSPCLPVSVFADWLWKKSFSMLNVKVSCDVLLITLCGGRSEKKLFLKWSARQRETCRRERGKKKERQKRKDINKQTPYFQLQLTDIVSPLAPVELLFKILHSFCVCARLNLPS